MKEKRALVGLIFLAPLFVALPLILLNSSSAFAALFDPGIAIANASNNLFQVDTYSIGGNIGSLSFTGGAPNIMTGNWSMSVHTNNVTNFQANILVVKADGSNSKNVELKNFVSQNTMKVSTSLNHTLAFTGLIDIVSSNQTANTTATITIQNFKAMNIVLGNNSITGFVGNQPIYGTLYQQNLNQTTTAGVGSTALLPEGSGTAIVGNSSPTLRLPQLPNPFLR